MNSLQSSVRKFLKLSLNLVTWSERPRLSASLIVLDVVFDVQIVKKTFNVPGPAAGGKSPKQIAAEITSFFTRNNFTVKDRSEVVV